jgi:hypothetical protein
MSRCNASLVRGVSSGMPRRSWVGLFVVLGCVGCAQAPSESWSDTAAAADEASLLLASEMALLVVPGNIDAAATPEATASAAAAAARDAFDPIGCASATADGAHVAYAFDGCSGSFGLVHATGTMDVTFTADVEGSSGFTARTTGLTLRGATVSFDVEAHVVRGVGIRTIDATTSSHGTSATGRAYDRTGEVTARWMDTWGCLFVDSASTTTELMGRTWSAEIEALTYCVGECPMVGGSMTLSGGRGDATLRLDYVGMPVVEWSVEGDATESGDLPIVCGV